MNSSLECSVYIYIRDNMSSLGVFRTLVGYHEYIGGSLVHQRDTMIHVGGYAKPCEGLHDHTRGC